MSFEKQLDDHERKFGIEIPDRKVYLDVPWPKNVLQHVLTAYHQRNSFIGSLSRSRTSLNLVLNTPDLDRRRSSSPNNRLTKSAASSATNTTKRKLAKTQRFGSTSNLKLVSEKISGFSVFNGPDSVRREPIMAYEDNTKIDEEPRLGVTKPVKNNNRQSMGDHLFRQLNNGETKMRRSISQQSLKQDVSMEAVVIDMPSLEGKYDTYNSAGSQYSDEDKYFSRWGPTRGSNSYSDAPNIPVSQLSTLDLKTVANDKSDHTDSVV